MAQKPGTKPKPKPKPASTKKVGLTGLKANPTTQVFSTPPKLTAYEKEMGFKVVKMTRDAFAGKTGTYYVVKATKPGQAKYMASGGKRRPKGRKGAGTPPSSRPDAPGSRPSDPGLPGLPGWRPYPGP